MLFCPTNSILVKISKRYDDELLFNSGVKLHIDPSWNPNFHATITGIVASAPLSLKGNRTMIPQQFEEGDHVLFSYKVVGDTTFENNTKSFYMTTKDTGYRTEWQNQEREVLRMEKGMNGVWAAIYADKKGDLISGKVGTQGEVENWCAQFKFMGGQGFSYDNMVEWEGESYWKIDIDYVFAIKKKSNGHRHWVMVGDYVLVEPIAEKKTEFIIPGIYRPPGDTLVVREDKGWVRNFSRWIPRCGISMGDVVFFDKGTKESYNVENKPMYIIHQKYLLGKET